ncbi:hypothetical protein Krac_0267 [Ktedonobacter racemifer DSM 44963]|uniref:Uncharacterized protein n=2 Tax=Ktedonobacter racemifer TaxID=363277 RepID=D6U7A3_KTERA|nr:hypothetical protein Krac_0267 [Ktedonobacter racemifer DSM 44963]
MATLVHFLQRRFQISSYIVSHSQLLLRSVKTKMFPTRIDVLFKPVDWICLPTHFNGLIVEAANPEQARIISTLSGISLDQSESFWVLRGGECEGYVVASVYFIDESTREDNEPDIWNEPLHWERESPTRPAYWREQGLHYGIRLWKAPPKLDLDFLDIVILHYRVIFADMPEELITAFIEGMKAGYAQPQPDKEPH